MRRRLAVLTVLAWGLTTAPFTVTAASAEGAPGAYLFYAVGIMALVSFVVLLPFIILCSLAGEYRERLALWLAPTRTRTSGATP